MKTPAPLATLSAAFLPDLAFVVLGGLDCQVTVQPVDPGGVGRLLPVCAFAHPAPVTSVCYSGDLVAAATSEGGVWWWDVGRATQCGAWQAKQAPPYDMVNQIVAESGGHAVYSALDDGCVRLCDYTQPESVVVVEGEAVAATLVDVRYPVMAVGSMDGGVRVYDVRRSGVVEETVLDSTVTLVLVGLGGVWLRDVQGGVHRLREGVVDCSYQSHETQENTQGWLVRARVSERWGWVVLGSTRGEVELHGASAGRWEVAGSGAVVDVGLDPSERYVYGTTSHGGVAVWDVGGA